MSEITDEVVSAFARGAQMGDPIAPGVTPLLERTNANAAKRIRDGLAAALSAIASRQPVAQAEALKAVADFDVATYVEGYEFRGDGDYTPNEEERVLLLDAIEGVRSEICDAILALTKPEDSQ